MAKEPRPAPSDISTRFAEGLFFQQIGVVGLHISVVSEACTLIKPVKSLSAYHFFRSMKAAARTVQELRISVRTIPTEEPETLVQLSITETDTAIQDAAERIGITIIGHHRINAAAARIATELDVAVEVIKASKARSRAYNQEFKTARQEAKELGLRIHPYPVWLVHKVGSSLQIGAMDKDNFSAFLPNDSGT